MSDNLEKYKQEKLRLLKIRNDLEIAFYEWKATKKQLKKAQDEYNKARMREKSHIRYHKL